MSRNTAHGCGGAHAARVDEKFQVIDRDAGRGWVLPDEPTAVQFAGAWHGSTGDVVEVLRVAAREASWRAARLSV